MGKPKQKRGPGRKRRRDAYWDARALRPAPLAEQGGLHGITPAQRRELLAKQEAGWSIEQLQARYPAWGKQTIEAALDRVAEERETGDE